MINKVKLPMKWAFFMIQTGEYVSKVRLFVKQFMTDSIHL